MWKPGHRKAARRGGLCYDSDMTNEEWGLVAPGRCARGPECDLLRSLDGLPVEDAAKGLSAQEHGSRLSRSVELGRHAAEAENHLPPGQYFIASSGTGTEEDPIYPQFRSGDGSTGSDYSANKSALPNVGANFPASGPYANYVLIKTLPAAPTRACIAIEDTSGAQIVIVRDDGTAPNGAAPANASAFTRSPSGMSTQGGSWSPTTFKGRIQIYAA